MSPEYPRILIFGQPFNSFSGGGITLTNLFKGWPKDRIAVTYLGHGLITITTDVCDTYYQLGEKEHRWRFPFSLIQKKFPSGLKTFEKGAVSSTGLKKKGPRYFLVNKIFYPALEWLGLFHCVSHIDISENFKKWLADFRPDVLYVQVATRETLLFASDLASYLKVPSAIHNMDDWPSTISQNGLFRNYWKRRIDQEFKSLLERMDLFLSISGAMSEEYLKRYSKVFIPFHNPIDISGFSGMKKRTFGMDDTIRILYLGRIGMANKESLLSFARAVSVKNREDLVVLLDIYTPDIDSPDSARIRNLRNVRILPPVRHDEVASLLTGSDLLLLPLDFNRTGLNYAQYSIPTKASEYMISGTPIIVYAPAETAVSKFCAENNCAFCLNKPGEAEVLQAIDYIIENQDCREKWAGNAAKLAGELFDARLVRDRFQTLLSGLADRSAK